MSSPVNAKMVSDVEIYSNCLNKEINCRHYCEIKLYDGRTTRTVLARQDLFVLIDQVGKARINSLAPLTHFAENPFYECPLNDILTTLFEQTVQAIEVNPTATEVTHFQISEHCNFGFPCNHDCKITLSDGRTKSVYLDKNQIATLVNAISGQKVFCNLPRDHFIDAFTTMSDPNQLLLSLW